MEREAHIWPYCGPPPDPAAIWAAWNTDPVLWLILAAFALFGAMRLTQQPDSRRQLALGVAMAAAVVAFASPLCALTVALFSARGLHHLVLVFALAPALALAVPLVPRRAGLALVALSAALWAWHVPMLYGAAWDHVAVYWAMQAALVLPAWGFWSGVLAARRDLGRTLVSGLQLGALAGQMGLIGAILTFAPRVLYPEHLVLTAAFGLDPLQDQQLAGLVMWVPGMLPVALAAGWMLRAAWLQAGRPGARA